MVKAYRNLEDPENIMALVNGPKFTSTNFHDRTSLPNLNANGHQDWTLFNTNLNTIHDLPLTSGFGYNYANGNAKHLVKHINLPIEVSYNRDMTVELQNLEEMQAGFNQRGVNFVNNAGPNTGFVAANYLQNFVFNVNTHKPNIYLFQQFFKTSYSTVTGNTISYNLQIIKMNDLNANIRTATAFPNHPQQVPVPTDESYSILDCSSLVGKTTAWMQNLAYHLSAIAPHYNTTTEYWYYIVDPSNSITGTYTLANSSLPAISWHNGTTAPLIARLLDDTLTRQDVRWALWFTSLPLPRFLSATDLTINGTNATKPTLTTLVWYPDNKQTYMKWLAKKGVEHNEYTISNIVANPTIGMELFRDVRICRTFFYQVITFMVKMSVAPDSNSLMDTIRIRNLVAGNIDGIDNLYTAVLTETNTHYSKWFAWIPYELAHAVNATVQLDSPRWRVSKSGYKIADQVKRSRSIMFGSDVAGQLDTSYYNQNDTDNTVNPLMITSQISATAKLTINALPVSLYWETSRFPIFTTSFDESILVSDEFLEEHAYFPETDLEQSWN